MKWVNWGAVVQYVYLFEIMWLRPNSKVGEMLIFYIVTANFLVGNFKWSIVLI